MKNDVAIKVSHLDKTFKVPHEKHSSLKAAAVNVFSPKKYTRFHALKNIDFEIKKGEFFGIVGKNGSGKSTLLKILANIYQPNAGKVEINGTLAPFIELGVGFNQELTGRENVFLSGTILGMKRKKIEEIYDDIVAFAEIEEFMDQKLKNYSSGMQVRLAFSIAVRAESDILLIDEVLAVGDAAFQAKCFDYFYQLKASGKTIVFVSHDMDSVKKFCTNALYIEHGSEKMLGDVKKIATEYSLDNYKQLEKQTKSSIKSKSEKLIFIKSLKVKKPVISYREDIDLTIEVNAKQAKDVVIGISFVREDGVYVAGFNSKEQLGKITLKVGVNKFQCNIKGAQLTKSRYRVDLAIFDFQTTGLVDDIQGLQQVAIVDGTDSKDGVFNVDGEWKVEK